MKQAIKSILFLLTISLVIVSCSDDDGNPPTANFTLSSNEPVQWDEVLINSQVTGADDVTYTVSGGDYVLADDNSSVRFLGEGSYSVKQTASNSDGTDTATINVVVSKPDNMYTFEDSEYSFSGNAFWYDGTATGGSSVYIRILGEDDGAGNKDLVKLYPFSGTNPIQGDYSYSSMGEVGTYYAGVTKTWDGVYSWDWTTNPDSDIESGNNLKVELVYEDPNNSANNVYDITLTSYTMDYGDWDFSTFTWISQGTKELKVQYRGVIEPI